MTDSEAGRSTWATEDYDVFLNHRGPDTKYNFCAHLEEALRFAGFRPFLDRLSLIVGDLAQESIYQALGKAKVHVAVVSKGYAESKYCLDELVAIKESQKPVIPVFYLVEISDLQLVEKGKFAEAFEKHKTSQTQETLQEWMDALLWLADFTGFCLRADHKDPDEAKLKQEVVNAVERRFPRGAGSVDENRPVGLEESRKEVVRKLESGRDGVVGLCGMGGIGKTTLATAVYECFARDFRHCCFLRDVRSSGALTLQNQIIQDLRLGMKVSSREEYQVRFHQFKDLKMLIVIDDIDNKEQFRDIIPDLGKICEGSRIIVTSRDRGVLSNVLITTPQLDIAETERSVLHEVEGLNSTESRQLFNFQAFRSKSPDSGFEDLAVKVADGCRGHPMALEIAGAFLRNKKNLETDRVFWDEMASTATKNEKLQSILKISYEKGLDNCHKTMFLDISCLLIGELCAVALEIWASCESCGCGIGPRVHSSLRELSEKSLVKVDTDGRLRMHDALRDMGREIVEAAIEAHRFKKWERTHLWDPKAADAVLEGRKGSDKVRGFSRARQDRVDRDTSIPTYDAEAFSEMSELHLLVLDGCLVSGDFSKWSRELRLLRWRFFPLSELPLELNLKNAAVVDLSRSTKLTRLWKDETPLRKARINLRRLILNSCIALTRLPQDIGKRLPILKVLELGSCVMLESLPDSVGEMTDLEQLVLHGCQKLQSIPHTVGRLKKLKHLDLNGCTELASLPDVGTLRLLKTLSLDYCHGLKSLPESMGTLIALTTLSLQCNLLITELPESFAGLISLVRLQMNQCPELRTVKALPRSLRHLDLGNCPMLDHLPSFIGLTSLATLTLCNCARLEEIQGLDVLTTLEEVNLTGCTSLPLGTLQLEHNPAMRSCCLSGSNVAVKYDSDWSKSEPALQLITYYDFEFGFVDDGLLQKVSAVEHCHKVCMEATVVGEEECVAVVICCVAHDQGWSDFVWDHGHYRNECFLDAWILRKGQEVLRQRLITLKHADCRDQVYLCTLRSNHPLVKVLKHGDKIRVAARSDHPKWGITVKCGAICVVHGRGEDQVISVNSKLLDVQQSQEKMAEFARLMLADNPECPAGQIVPSAPSVPNLEPGSFYIEPRFFLHKFERYWTFPSPGQGVLSFVAHPVDDAEVDGLSICISPQSGQVVPRYEIRIGTGLSWIRRHVMWDSDSNQYGIARFFGLDNPLGHNPLWVSIDKENRVLRVGRGEAHEDVFLEYEDHDFFSDVQYISLSTYGNPIIYSDVIVM